MSSKAQSEALTPREPGTVAHLRWYICGLLFFATTVNYMDRQVLGMLQTTLEDELKWDPATYAWVVFSFKCAYALMMPIAGRLIDWLGTRLGYAVAVVVWSLASMSHSVARTVWQFAAARFALGVGEAANFPAALRTVADWFPARERAQATGIFNAGSNVGILAAALLVPFIATHFHWRYSFLATGLLDFVWVGFWLLLFRLPRQHKMLSKAELALIESDAGGGPPRKVKYSRLLGTKQAWALVIAKFLTDPVWWFYLFWLPGFFGKEFNMKLQDLPLPLVTIYLAADVGSIAGGMISSRLMHRGWSVNGARKTAMLVCGIAVLPVMFVGLTASNLWVTIALISIAAAAHQGYSANLLTLPSDLFPQSTVASMAGLAGLGGAIGGILAEPAVGYWLKFNRTAYGPIFVICGAMYLLALLVVHLILPKLERTEA